MQNFKVQNYRKASFFHRIQFLWSLIFLLFQAKFAYKLHLQSVLTPHPDNTPGVSFFWILSRGHSRKTCRISSSKLIELCKQRRRNSPYNKFNNLKRKREVGKWKTRTFLMQLKFVFACLRFCLTNNPNFAPQNYGKKV